MIAIIINKAIATVTTITLAIIRALRWKLISLAVTIPIKIANTTAISIGTALQIR